MSNRAFRATLTTATTTAVQGSMHYWVMSATAKCSAIRCTEVPLPDGMLCDIHQARLDRGGGLPRTDEPILGEASGFGRFGELHVNKAGILCHECGLRLVSLSHHLRLAHQLSADEYRNRHGLFDETPLHLPPNPDGRPRRRPHPCRRCAADVFTKAKLCPDCSAAFWADRGKRRQDRGQSRPRWRELTQEEISELLGAREDERSALVQRLQDDRVSSKEIGTVLGLTQGRMSALFPRKGWGTKKIRKI